MIEQTLKEYMEQEEQNSKQYKIFKFFMNSEFVEDDKIEEFLKENKIEKEEFDDIVYRLLHSFASTGKWNRNGRPKIDVDQLTKGIEVEFEHSDNSLIAEKIALDHLSESENSSVNYYSFLEIMERLIEQNVPLKKLEDLLE